MLAFGQDLGSKLSVRVTYVVKSYFAVVIHQDIRVAGWVKDQLLCMANLVITQDSSFVAVSSLFHARVGVTVQSSSYESFTLSHHLLVLLLLLLLLGLVVGWVNDQLLCMANLVITQDSSFVAVSSLFHARVRVTV